MLQTVPVTGFDAETFEEVVRYAHSGTCAIHASKLIALMNAADKYGFPSLVSECQDRIPESVTLETIIPHLKSANQYIANTHTKAVVKSLFAFVDEHAEQVLALTEFVDLPFPVVKIIISRGTLQVGSHWFAVCTHTVQASELSKFNAILLWGESAIQSNSASVKLSDLLAPFWGWSSYSHVVGVLNTTPIDHIAFHLMSPRDLVSTVQPSEVVPDAKIMTALAYQADPASVELASIAVLRTTIA